MMKLQNSEIYAILPDSFKSVENRCISYALSRAVRGLCETAKNASVYANIGGLSEDILDYLASELRAPYYSQEWSRDEKAAIILSALPWFMRAGTKSALENLLSAVYGGAAVTEWFEYSGQPYHFKLEVNGENDYENADFTDTLLSVVQGGKNFRSVLDLLGLSSVVSTSKSAAPFIGCAIHQNILQSGAASDLDIILGCSSFDAEVENIIRGGTFDEPAEDVLDCGIF